MEMPVWTIVTALAAVASLIGTTIFAIRSDSRARRSDERATAAAEQNRIVSDRTLAALETLAAAQRLALAGSVSWDVVPLRAGAAYMLVNSGSADADHVRIEKGWPTGSVRFAREDYQAVPPTITGPGRAEVLVDIRGDAKGATITVHWDDGAQARTPGAARQREVAVGASSPGQVWA